MADVLNSSRRDIRRHFLPRHSDRVDMKSLRALCYLCVGLLLGANVVLAYAETQPATLVATEANYFWYVNAYQPTVASVNADPAIAAGYQAPYGATCSTISPSAMSATCNKTTSTGGVGGAVYLSVAFQCPGTSTFTQASSLNQNCGTHFECPDNTWTLSESTCTKIEACPGAQTMPEGSAECICDAASINALAHESTGVQGDGSMPDMVCFNSCLRTTGDCVGGGGHWWCVVGKATGAKCTGDAQGGDSPPTDKPPCDASEGVLTSSTGHVLCVPEGTPTARKPEVKKTDKTTKTGEPPTVTTETKTVTKDPATGSTDTHTTTTTTNPDGTKTTTETSTGGGTGDDSGEEPGMCAKEPDSPLCKKGEVGEEGEFTDRNPKIAEARNELISYFNTVRGEISSMFSALGGGGGSLPCPPSVSVLGATIKVCASDYANQLSKIGAIVIAMATLVAAFIIFKG